VISLSSVLIRPATPADIPAIRTLERAAETAAHWTERDYGALFASDAPKRLTLVAYDEELLGGFAVARCGPDEWEIENVVVAPEHRRRGIGSRLVREIMRMAVQGEAGLVLLEVRESNLAARHLYEQLGFTEAGRRPGYYHRPAEDALILRFSTRIL